MKQQGLTDSLPAVKVKNNVVLQLRTQTIPQLAGDAAQVMKTREAQLAMNIASDSVKLLSIPGQSMEQSHVAT